MKFVLMILVFSSILFASQRQLILGSYLTQDRGIRALNIINEQIENDIQLKAFMQEYSLRAINTKISGYTVVSINAFDSYRTLLNMITALQYYYPDCYALYYPTQNIRDVEGLEEIKEKAELEEDIKSSTDILKEDDVDILSEELSGQDILESQRLEKYLEEKVDFEAMEHGREKNLVSPQGTVQKDPFRGMQKGEGIQVDKDEVSHTKGYLITIITLAVIALLGAGITVLIIARTVKRKKRKDDI